MSSSGATYSFTDANLREAGSRNVHAGAEEPAATPPRRRLWSALRRDPTFWLGAVLVGGVVIAAILAPLLAPHDPTTQFDDGISLIGAPLSHTAKFPLGTDFEGRDVPPDDPTVSPDGRWRAQFGGPDLGPPWLDAPAHGG